jgi:hypothetical protein
VLEEPVLVGRKLDLNPRMVAVEGEFTGIPPTSGRSWATREEM